MMRKMTCFVVVAAMLVIGVAISQEAKEAKETGDIKHTADRHRDNGVTCGACHGGENAPREAAAPESCLTCKNHDSWDAADKRIKENKEYKVNPHRNHISEANDLECTMCHQAHNADTVFCMNCHQGLKFR